MTTRGATSAGSLQAGRRWRRSASAVTTVTLCLGLLVEGAALPSAAAAERNDGPVMSVGDPSPRLRPSTGLGRPLLVPNRTVQKSLLSAAQAQRASRSRAVAGLTIANDDLQPNQYGNTSAKRLYVARLYPGRAGAVPASVNIVQMGTQHAAKIEILAYRNDVDRDGGRNYFVTENSVTHVFRVKKVRISRTSLRSSSAVVVAVCQSSSTNPVTTHQLIACSRGMAAVQEAQSRSLFRSAPEDTWRVGRLTLQEEYVPWVRTDTSPSCAAKLDPDPTTSWCPLAIRYLDAGTVPVTRIAGLSAKSGTVTSGEYQGRLTVLYTPTRDGPFTDVVTYRLFNDEWDVSSPTLKVTIKGGRNGNYFLTASDYSVRVTPQTYSDPEPYCAAFHPPDPTLQWCRTVVNLTSQQLVSGYGFYDTVEVYDSESGDVVATSEFVDGSWTIALAPQDNGPFSERITYRAGNTRLGVWSNVATITATFDQNTNYRPHTP